MSRVQADQEHRAEHSSRLASHNSRPIHPIYRWSKVHTRLRGGVHSWLHKSSVPNLAQSYRLKAAQRRVLLTGPQRSYCMRSLLVLRADSAAACSFWAWATAGQELQKSPRAEKLRSVLRTERGLDGIPCTPSCACP